MRREGAAAVGPHDAHTTAGHGAHGGHADHAAQFRDRFWWSLRSPSRWWPSVRCSPTCSATTADVAGTGWVSPVLGTVVFFYGGWPFLTGAVAEVRARRPGMMLLDRAGDHASRSWRAGRTTPGRRRLRPGLLVGARAADRDHAARATGWRCAPWAQASARWTRWPPCCPTRPSGSAPTGSRAGRRSRTSRPATSCWCGPAGGSRPTATIVDGAADVDESMITGESRPVPTRLGRPGGRRHGGHRLRAAGPGRRGRRGHRAGRHPAAGRPRRRRRASRAQALADRAAARCSTSPPAPRLITFVVWFAARRRRRGRRADRHRAGHRLPARPRPGHPAGHRHLHGLAARAGILVKDRLALERMRTGGRGAVRQDRHPHHAASRRSPASPAPARDRGRRAGAGRRGRGRQRASAGPGHRRGRRGPRRRVAAGDRSSAR